MAVGPFVLSLLAAHCCGLAVDGRGTTLVCRSDHAGKDCEDHKMLVFGGTLTDPIADSYVACFIESCVSSVNQQGLGD